MLSACSRSQASPPRTSPTISRSGRCRIAARSSSRTVTAGKPPAARRAANRTRFGCRSGSSTVSSTASRRSDAGTKSASAARNVVLPAPVPPPMRTDSRSATPRRNAAASPSDRLPARTSAASVRRRRANFRMVRTGPPKLHGGSAAATREPSGSRASSSGSRSVMSSPKPRAMAWAARRTRRGSGRNPGTGSSRPPRSTNTASALTITSVTVSSSSRPITGPRNGATSRNAGSSAKLIAAPSPRPRSSPARAAGTRA